MCLSYLTSIPQKGQFCCNIAFITYTKTCLLSLFLGDRYEHFSEDYYSGSKFWFLLKTNLMSVMTLCKQYITLHNNTWHDTWFFLDTENYMKQLCTIMTNNICNITSYSYQISNPVINEVMLFSPK